MLQLGSNKNENNAIFLLSKKHISPVILTFLISGFVLRAVNGSYFLPVFDFS